MSNAESTEIQTQNPNRRMLVNYYSMLEKNHDEIIQKRREIDDRITKKQSPE